MHFAQLSSEHIVTVKEIYFRFFLIQRVPLQCQERQKTKVLH